MGDGDWDEVGTSSGQIAYRNGNHYLYYAESSADNFEKFWTISLVLRADDFENGWCDATNILSCSGQWQDEQTGAQFTICSHSVTSQPAAAPSDNDNNGNGNGGDGTVNDGDTKTEEETVLPGVDDNVFYFLIALIAICLCCVLLGCVFICWRNRRLGTHAFDEKVGTHANDW